VPSPSLTLSTENLTVRFGGLLAISSVSMPLISGEIVGLIGPNGAGHTHERKRRTRGRLRQEERDLRAPVESWAAFEAHLDRWTREVADQREHGTTGVAPAERFAAEARALRPLAGRASVRAVAGSDPQGPGRLRDRSRHD